MLQSTGKPEPVTRLRRQKFRAGAGMMAIHLRTSLQRAQRIVGAALVAMCGAAIFAPAQAESAAAASKPSAAFFTVSSPLEDTDLDHVRGHGFFGAPMPSGGMQVGVVLWDEYRRPQPSQGGGISSTGSSAVLPSGSAAVAIRTTSPGGQR